eukprot:366340-Chlamydomonas_euryale.AAC.13
MGTSWSWQAAWPSQALSAALEEPTDGARCGGGAGGGMPMCDGQSRSAGLTNGLVLLDFVFGDDHEHAAYVLSRNASVPHTICVCAIAHVIACLHAAPAMPALARAPQPARLPARAHPWKRTHTCLPACGRACVSACPAACTCAHACRADASPRRLAHALLQVAPGFFDAPGSAALSFPSTRAVAGPGVLATTRPAVVIAFSSIEAYGELAAANAALMRDALQLHNAAVRETLSAFNGCVNLARMQGALEGAVGPPSLRAGRGETHRQKA